MMRFIDTHTHLYTEEFDDDRKEVITRAIEAGIYRFYCPAIDSSYTEKMLAAKALFPDKIFLMAGLHPCSVKEDFRTELEKVEEFLSSNQVAGIGETGLDYHWDKTFIKEQKESLRQHGEWAIEYNKPLILHTRESIDDAISIVEEYIPRGLTGIFHCFSGNLQQAKKIVSMGFSLGIGGVLTFKNSGLASVISEIPMEYIVLETDSPYLSPAPYRGKRNESARLILIAEKLASVKNIPLEEVAQITTDNALKIYQSEYQTDRK